MESVVTALGEYLVKKTNKWSKLKHSTDVSNWPGESVSREIKLYETY